MLVFGRRAEDPVVGVLVDGVAGDTHDAPVGEVLVARSLGCSSASIRARETTNEDRPYALLRAVDLRSEDGEARRRTRRRAQRRVGRDGEDALACAVAVLGVGRARIAGRRPKNIVANAVEPQRKAPSLRVAHGSHSAANSRDSSQLPVRSDVASFGCRRRAPVLRFAATVEPARDATRAEAVAWIVRDARLQPAPRP